MSRIIIAISVISALALLVDVYIYRRVISRHNFGKLWSYGYIIYAVVIDTMIVSALIAYRNVSDMGTDSMMRMVMWVIGIFFLNFIPKIIYSVVSLGDYLVQYFRKRTSHIFGYTGTLLAIIAVAVLLNGLTLGRSRIRVEDVRITIPSLPEELEGVRIVQFSDNHIGTLVNRDRFLTRFVDKINSLDADLVFQTGDIVNAHSGELDRDVMAIFSRINSKYGVYSVLGNHDLGIYIHDSLKIDPAESVRDLISKQEEMGWTVLVNRSVRVPVGETEIVITGINFPSGEMHAGRRSGLVGTDYLVSFADVPDSLFNIAMSHTPNIWEEILMYGNPQLTLSGHIHAMQLKFNLGSFHWSPASLLYDRWSGLYEDDDRYLYINDGAGYVMYPMRVGTRPEITLMTLTSGRLWK